MIQLQIRKKKCAEIQPAVTSVYGLNALLLMLLLIEEEGKFFQTSEM